jgi:hypothetical protein
VKGISAPRHGFSFGALTRVYRCSRRGVECVHSEGVRKRTARKAGAANRTSKLEERLNDLVELIRLQQQGNPAPAPGLDARIDPALGVSDHTPPSNGIPKPAATLSPSQVPDATYPTPSTNAALTHPSVSSNPSPNTALADGEDELSPLQKEELFNRFRTDYLAFFPFMWIKPEVTAEDIERTRPFLWLNIRAVCEKYVPKMHELGNKIREELARRVLVELERDQEVVLGLLIYLGWFVLLYGDSCKRDHGKADCRCTGRRIRREERGSRFATPTSPTRWCRISDWTSHLSSTAIMPAGSLTTRSRPRRNRPMSNGDWLSELLSSAQRENPPPLVFTASANIPQGCPPF